MTEYLSTEQQVKDVLGVNNFQNLSQKQMMEFVKKIPVMDKEVAIAIMNQFPEFTESATSMLEQLNVLCDNGIKSNDASQREAINAYKKILDDLSEELKNKNLTFDEKQKIYKKMVDIADCISKKDTENKIFLKEVIGGIAVSICAVGAFLFAMMWAGSSEDKGGSDVYKDDRWTRT